MKIYLNAKTSIGLETIDEFEREEGQTAREFRAYIAKIISDYWLAGIAVYRSSRCCANWK